MAKLDYELGSVRNDGSTEITVSIGDEVICVIPPNCLAEWEGGNVVFTELPPTPPSNPA